ncbi:MAG TPA: hypothetical protein VMH00_15935 [Candidatus Limnocylindrales bacterium]|nr:hypothetical protein [Candidatus Limnocylindrales bacterium]
MDLRSQPDGRVADVEVETFDDVKPKYPASEIVDGAATSCS